MVQLGETGILFKSDLEGPIPSLELCGRREASTLISCPLTCTHVKGGAREMVQWPKALAAFPEDLGSASHTHTVTHNHLSL